MKKIVTLSFLLVFITLFAAGQSKPKPKAKQPSQTEINKMLEEAMKGEGMSKEEQQEMKKMMGDIMPNMMEKAGTTVNYPTFASNRELVPSKNKEKINAIPKVPNVSSYAAILYTKLIAKGKPAEITLIRQILAKVKNANDMNVTAITAMLQGHEETAMALSMKAVQSNPANTNYQNNMAALLTQYGYAEQAIPVLQKIRNQFPGNSTVLSNLAHAWLSLGEIDSAKVYSNGAILVNPNHPEALLCGGLIDEVRGGDPIDKYTGAMENAPNPFIEQVLKNKNASLDFEKLKRNITYHEYFPKDWIKIPKLSDNISGYENDKRIKNGYDKMFDDLQLKIDALKEASENEINVLVNKGENEFVKEMMKENVKGISMMSKPASVVQMVLQTYLADWMEKYNKEYQQLLNSMDAKKEAMTKSGKNDKCPDWDRKNNEFLSYANPIIRKFHTKKTEEFRTWLNIYCTWVWYITGNPKNTVMIQCVAWTEGLKSFYQNAIEGQYAIAKSCVKQNDEGVETVATPNIPNFTCPTVVSVPSGTEWNELSSITKNFDANKYGIKQTATPVPNVSVAYGVGNMIAQPGIAPFIKTANGSVTPSTGGADELAPIPKIEKGELVPIPKIPLEELTPLPNIPKGDELTPIPDLRKSQLAKELLKKTMTANCNGKKSTKKLKFKTSADFNQLKIEEADELKTGIGELVIEPITEIVVGTGELTIEPIAGKDTFKVGIGKLEFAPMSKSEINKIVQEVKAAISEGLQPTISNGVQVPGTFKTNKGLFK